MLTPVGRTIHHSLLIGTTILVSCLVSTAKRDLLSTGPLSSSAVAGEEREDVAIVYGFRVENEEAQMTNKEYVIPADTPMVLRLFGKQFTPRTQIAFTSSPGHRGDDCNELARIGNSRLETLTDAIAEATIALPLINRQYYMCVDGNVTKAGVTFISWVHQGSDEWMTLTVKGRLMPIPVQIMLIILCLVLCSCFSGLNLGLMALDMTELEVLSACGTDAEKRYARAIRPVRKHGNYLLCTLLFSNVLVNSIQTVLLEDLTSGLVAVVGSTLSIVIIGEIIPQAVCSRHGLAVGANTIYLTYLFMILTFPISYPISLILNKILGKEIGNVYDRERLIEYLRVTKDYNKLETDEVNIVKGALKFKTITVEEVMTNLEDVYMLPHNAVLDFHTLSDIQKRGYSRIPVYEHERKNIVALLFARDLAFVDPEDKIPLKMLTNFYKHPVVYVFEDSTLDIALNEFKQGRSHMAFVIRIFGDRDVDPHPEIIGIVTLEDVIEEVLQVEIVDETDTLTDNRRKMRRKEIQAKQDFSDFAGISEEELSRYVVSPQLALAAYQYISTTVNEFSADYVSETILRRLMAQKIYFQHNPATDNEDGRFLFKMGEPADYFILILEGKVRVTIGKEQLVFECGSFNHFGACALNYKPKIEATSPTISRSSSTINEILQNEKCYNTIEKPKANGQIQRTSMCLTPLPSEQYIPDFSVEIVETTTYLKITKAVYEQACQASKLERESSYL